MKTFQEWYTGITVEGPMEHMMERAWNAAIAGADARVLADMKKRLAYGPNDEAAIGAYEQDRIAEQVHRELYSGAPAQAEPVDLHAAIMNLACNVPGQWSLATQAAYKTGHRDARHAAAELAAAPAQAEPSKPEGMCAIGIDRRKGTVTLTFHTWQQGEAYWGKLLDAAATPRR